MKRMILLTSCLFVIPTHAAQALAQGVIKQTGDVLDIAANVTVVGTVQAPLTIHIPSETQTTLIRLAAEAGSIGYGIGLIANGTKTLIVGENTHTPSEDLEAGLHKRSPLISPQLTKQALDALVSDPLLLDEEEQPKKTCCSCLSRVARSQGIRQIIAGWFFIGSGLSLEFLRK